MVRGGFALVVALAVVVSTVSAFAQDVAARGQRLFIEQGCYGCHQIGNVGTQIGPNLSHIGAKYGRAQLAAWLHDPREQKPTAHMPKINLSAEETEALSTYLASLR